MRVVLFTPYSIWSPHFETDLEIIQTHLDQGDQVEAVVCNSDLKVCDANPTHSFDKCITCIGRRWVGFGLLSARIPSHAISSIGTIDHSKLANLRMDFKSNEELKSYTFYGYDLGFATLSSLVSILREPEPNFESAAVQQTMEKLLRTSASLFLAFQAFLDAKSVDRVYVFNARFAITRPILRACQSRGIDCFCHDRGGTIHKYELYHDALPHDTDRFSKGMRSAWEQADAEDRETIGHQFYTERRASVEQNWISFTKGQQPGLLPEGWDSARRNIVFFVSDEEEFSSVDRVWDDRLYETQAEAIQSVADAYRDDHEFFFYARVHPSLVNVNNSQTRALDAIGRGNVAVIPAHSPVSSYALLDACEKVLTFGSTVGIEATYSRKPSIICSTAFYASLDAVYRPKSHKEVVQLLGNRLPPKPITGALQYGFYLKTFGRTFRYFEPSGLFSGKFKGVQISPPLPVRLVVRGLSKMRSITAKA